MYNSDLQTRWLQGECWTPYSHKGVVLELIRCWCLGVSPEVIINIILVANKVFGGLNMVRAVIARQEGVLYGVAPLNGQMRYPKLRDNQNAVGDQWLQLVAEERH